MSWSDKQRKLALLAANNAGWSSEHRYIVMRHCGCPLDPETQRPSLKHPRNTPRQFGLYMSFAEPVARANGKPLRPPRNHRSWEQAAGDEAIRQRHLARRICEEAARRLPAMFDRGLEAYIVRHVAAFDKQPGGAGFLEHEPECFDQCDGATMHRVVESLRAFVGREFAQRGIVPNAFSLSPSAKRRVAQAASP